MMSVYTWTDNVQRDSPLSGVQGVASAQAAHSMYVVLC